MKNDSKSNPNSNNSTKGQTSNLKTVLGKRPQKGKVTKLVYYSDDDDDDPDKEEDFKLE